MENITLLGTDSSPLKIGHPKRKQSYSNHPFSGANLLLVSGRVDLYVFLGNPGKKKHKNPINQHLQVGVPYMVPLQGVTENHPLGFKDGTPLKVLEEPSLLAKL